MIPREMPEFLYIQCPDCDDITEHTILKGRMGNDNITGTFRCASCGRVFSDSIRIPRQFTVKVLLSEGDVTESCETTLEEDEILENGDEFYLDDGRRVCITHFDVMSGKNVRKAHAVDIKRLWVKHIDIMSIKISVNDYKKTYSLRVEADPDDEFVVGDILQFEDFDCLIHVIKTKTGVVRNGSAEARDITRVYGKIRRKEYDVLDFDDEDSEFDPSEFEEFEEEEDQ